jgi:hypothetical protein
MPASAGRRCSAWRVNPTRPVDNGSHIINWAHKSLTYIAFFGTHHSHSMVAGGLLLTS